ncbi:MAG: hypothetical protein HY764_03985 [Candidatus Portnoybacteria bacterium]|nr:hypothetical protein [Candidatus Portnoybacteria bacterium]
MNTKKLFITSLVLLLFAAGALVVYNFYIKKEPTSETENEGIKTDLKINIISKAAVLAPTISEDGQTIKYYSKADGHVLKSNFDGSGEEVISSANLPDLEGVVWSPDKKKVISIFEKNGQTTKSVFNYQARANNALNENVRSINFSPDSQKIVYQYQNASNDQNNISVADANGQNWKNIFTTRLTNLIVEWPGPDKISIGNSPSGLVPGSLFTIDPESGNLTKILSDIYGLSVKWSKKKKKIIYQTTNEKGKDLKLFVTQIGSGQATLLPLKTIAEKCVWGADSQKIFCAVPQGLSEGVAMPDDYLNGKIIIRDDIYMIDVASQKTTKIAQSNEEQSFDAKELILSPEEDYLFFINGKNGLLCNIKLK